MWDGMCTESRTPHGYMSAESRSRHQDGNRHLIKLLGEIPVHDEGEMIRRKKAFRLQWKSNRCEGERKATWLNRSGSSAI